MAKKRKRKNMLIRAHLKFISELEDIKKMRVVKGKDSASKPKTNSRLTLALTRHPLFKQIKNDAINAELKEWRGK